MFASAKAFDFLDLAASGSWFRSGLHQSPAGSSDTGGGSNYCIREARRYINMQILQSLAYSMNCGGRPDYAAFDQLTFV